MSIHAPFRFLVAAAAALLIATLIASSSAHGMLLGDVAAQSALGAPLRVVIPVKFAPGESPDAACFRVVPSTAGAGASIVTARVSLERAAATPRLIVTTPNAINEPAVQFTIQAGCDGTTRRNYVLLLDPPTATHGAAATYPARAREPGQERPALPLNIVRRSDDVPRGESHAIQRTVSEDRGSGVTVAVVAPGGRERADALASPAAASVHRVPAPAPASAAPPAARHPLSILDAGQGDLWWYLAASLIAIGAIALGTLFVRQRRALPEVPEWTHGAAYTGPRSFTDLSAAPVTLSSAEVTALPAQPSGTRSSSVAPSLLTVEVTAPSLARRTPLPDPSLVDTAISEMDADMIEERAVREAWASARSDVERQADGNAILRAIEAAERELLLAPPAPAQAAMDVSLDDDLLAAPRRPDKAAA